jgi:hypothetical protein
VADLSLHQCDTWLNGYAVLASTRSETSLRADDPDRVEIVSMRTAIDCVAMLETLEDKTLGAGGIDVKRREVSTGRASLRDHERTQQVPAASGI